MNKLDAVREWAGKHPDQARSMSYQEIAHAISLDCGVVVLAATVGTALRKAGLSRYRRERMYVNGVELISTAIAAEQFGYTPHHLRVLRKEGKLPAYQDGHQLFWNPTVIQSYVKGERQGRTV